MKVVLVYNVRSGGRYDARRLKAAFRRHGLDVTYSFTIGQLSSKKLSALVHRGVTVAVVGGDGTLNAAARLLAGSASIMLPLPGGTFNHFVRDLGMPLTVDDILSNIGSARVRRIDVAYVNDELFLNNSNLGLYPFSLIERKAASRLLGKWAAAVLSALDQLGRFRRHRLVIGGERLRSPFVFIGNNVFDIRRSLIPERTGFTDGVMTVMVASSRSRFRLVRAIFAVLRGDISNQADFSLSARKSMTIYSPERSLPVSFDGEVKRLTPPLHYRIEPKALRVLVVKSPEDLPQVI